MTEDEYDECIVTTERSGLAYQVVGERLGDFGWYADNWRIDCVAVADYPNRNLVPQKHTQVLNIAREAGKFWGFLHDSRAEADLNAGAHRISCIEVTFTEGEGLD